MNTDVVPAKPRLQLKKPTLDVPVGKGWKLVLRQTRQDTLDAIANAATIPESAKNFLLDQVNALDEKVNLIRLDAHCSYENSGFHVNISIVPLRG